MGGDRHTYSRYQILCADREAWIDVATAHGDGYYYDGISFWRVEPGGQRRLLPSWRTPSHGWRHAAGCACDLCSALRPAPLRPASVA
jgi:hypothetical protein